MKKISILSLTILGLVGCNLDYHVTTSHYMQDSRTGLCFLTNGYFEGTITQVPCTKEVLEQIKNEAK